MWQAWTNGILGIWVVIAAFLNFTPSMNVWNDLVIGIVVAYVGYTIVKVKSWQGWLGVIMGLWLVVSVFFPTLLSGAGYLWNDLLSGILIMIAGFGALKNDTAKAN